MQAKKRVIAMETQSLTLADKEKKQNGLIQLGLCHVWSPLNERYSWLKCNHSLHRAWLEFLWYTQTPFKYAKTPFPCAHKRWGINRLGLILNPYLTAWTSNSPTVSCEGGTLQSGKALALWVLLPSCMLKTNSVSTDNRETKILIHPENLKDDLCPGASHIRPKCNWLHKN